MRRYSLILCLVLIVSLSGVASAQIVLGPPPAAAGGVQKMASTFGGTTGTSFSYVQTYPGVGGFATAGSLYGYPFSLYIGAHGAFEFYLGTATFPTTMTANNFTAKLDGLNVALSTYFTSSPTPMDIDLFDMGDVAEDGVITVGDFNNTRGSRIARRTQTFGGAPADFNNVSVTDAVRNDLFGAGAGDFSGFILKPNLSAEMKGVIYDPSTPTLTINPGVSPPPGGGGGGGGGGCFIANAAR